MEGWMDGRDIGRGERRREDQQAETTVSASVWKAQSVGQREPGSAAGQALVSARGGG